MSKIKVIEYNLPDSILYQRKIVTPASKVWIPLETCIILGKSNNPIESIFVDRVVDDNIPIYKRPSGGETVILSDKMIVVSAVIEQTGFKSGQSYFQYFSDKIITAISNHGIENLYCNGISDISINKQKIMGSAIYQNKSVVFYHAVLNVNESIELIDKYLKHPVREPDYRHNRNHLEFVTSLKKEGYGMDKQLLVDAIKQEFEIINFS